VEEYSKKTLCIRNAKKNNGYACVLRLYRPVVYLNNNTKKKKRKKKKQKQKKKKRKQRKLRKRI